MSRDEEYLLLALLAYLALLFVLIGGPGGIS